MIVELFLRAVALGRALAQFHQEFRARAADRIAAALSRRCRVAIPWRRSGAQADLLAACLAVRARLRHQFVWPSDLAPWRSWSSAFFCELSESPSWPDCNPCCELPISLARAAKVLRRGRRPSVRGPRQFCQAGLSVLSGLGQAVVVLFAFALFWRKVRSSSSRCWPIRSLRPCTASLVALSPSEGVADCVTCRFRQQLRQTLQQLLRRNRARLCAQGPRWPSGFVRDPVASALSNLAAARHSAAPFCASDLQIAAHRLAQFLHQRGNFVVGSAPLSASISACWAFAALRRRRRRCLPQARSAMSHMKLMAARARPCRCLMRVSCQ